MESIVFALAVGGYFVVGFAWPTLRLWRRYGVWPIVFDRESAPAQRLLGALTAALFVGMLGLAGLHAIVGPAALGVWPLPLSARIVGWAALLGGAVLTVVAQRQMGASWRVGIDDRPTALVTSGLFAVIRNPIFSGLMLFVAGVATLSAAWWSVTVAALTVLALRVQVALEERHLITLHGGAYLDYAARAGRFVPVIGRLRVRSAVVSGGGSAAAARG